MKFQNTVYTNDNLFVLNGMNSESVDLIYLDPPFNSKRLYAAPAGSKAAGAAFKDIWTWADVDEDYLDGMVSEYEYLPKFINSIEALHGKAMMAYVTYMTQRLIQLHRVLKSTGSIYLHCDPTASHYLKLVLDMIFGKGNFRNEIIWAYPPGGRAPKLSFHRKHDIILYYGKSQSGIFHPQYSEVTEQAKAKFTSIEAGSGRRFKRYPGGISYLDEYKGRPVPSWWMDIHSLGQTISNERTGYPTQKPLALLERIINASSNPGDIVLDPFCGCATTCVAAQNLNRKWIGIDVEEKSAELVIQRLSGEFGMFNDFVHRKDIPKRTDVKATKRDTSAKTALYKKQSGKCNGCAKPFDIENFEIDHIVPRSKGGGDYMENYQLLCGNCNRVKGDRPMEYLRMKIKALMHTKRALTFGDGA